MATDKKIISVRFTDSTRKDVEAFAKKFDMSLSMAVNFLTNIAIEEIKKGQKTLISKTIFEYNPEKDQFFLKKSL